SVMVSVSENTLWPEWRIKIDQISLEDNQITFLRGENVVSAGDFNPAAILLTDFNFQLEDLYLKDKTAGAKLQDLSFVEGSGVDVEKISFEMEMTDESLSVKDFSFIGVDSRLSGELSSRFSELQDLIEMREETEFRLDFPEIYVNLNGINRFAPDLARNEYFSVLSKDPIKAVLHVSGSFSD